MRDFTIMEKTVSEKLMRECVARLMGTGNVGRLVYEDSASSHVIVAAGVP